MIYVIISPNHQENMTVLEHYHKDIVAKIAKQCWQHIFHGKKESMAKNA